jgi:peptidoglycan hydrolase CwlO-like protein
VGLVSGAAVRTLEAMRAKPGTPRWLLLFASILLAALCVAAGASAETLREKLRDTQGQLDRVRDSQSALSATIADQNRAIDTMLGEVSALRQRQQAAEAELAAKQAELDEATEKLEAEQRRLARIRARLRRALGVLRERLVGIYLTGTPDTLTVVLESESWADVGSRADYLSRIQSYDSAIAERVEGLRDEARAAVERMAEIEARLERSRDTIAVKEREAEEASEEAAARFAELKAAQDERQEALDALQSREAALSDNLASISEQIADAGGTPPASAPAPLTPGQEAEYISESQASVPAAAPPAVKAAIEAANSIATTPYVWGGGHGSFESSGYDCSGAVSFALHGGGFLDSPLDSTGLTTWGEPGPGQWITVYGNAGHAWMIIAGLAFDTSGGAGPRWHPTPVSSTSGFIARHPAGY